MSKNERLCSTCLHSLQLWWWLTFSLHIMLVCITWSLNSCHVLLCIFFASVLLDFAPISLLFKIIRQQWSHDHLKFTTHSCPNTDLLFESYWSLKLYFLAVGPSLNSVVCDPSVKIDTTRVTSYWSSEYVVLSCSDLTFFTWSSWK